MPKMYEIETVLTVVFNKFSSLNVKENTSMITTKYKVDFQI